MLSTEYSRRAASGQVMWGARSGMRRDCMRWLRKTRGFKPSHVGRTQRHAAGLQCMRRWRINSKSMYSARARADTKAQHLEFERIACCVFSRIRDLGVLRFS